MLRCLVVTTSGLRVTPHGRPGYPLLRECNGCPARGVQPSLRGLNGVSTHCSWSGWRRAGRPDEPWSLQASLRGCNAERRRSAGLFGDRTPEPQAKGSSVSLEMSTVNNPIAAIQQALQEAGLDGWLFYDFRGSDPLAARILKLDPARHTPRRWYYLIPAQGTPTKILHKIEPHSLDEVPGERRLYLSWPEQHARLRPPLAPRR